MTTPTGPVGWKRTRIDVERTYEITNVPDMQDDTSRRRKMIRPRKVTLHQMYGTNMVRGACIEGQQVCEDGSLGLNRQIAAGISRHSWGYSATPPAWLNDILYAELLVWATDDQVSAHRD